MSGNPLSGDWAKCPQFPISCHSTVAVQEAVTQACFPRPATTPTPGTVKAGQPVCRGQQSSRPGRKRSMTTHAPYSSSQCEAAGKRTSGQNPCLGAQAPQGSGAGQVHYPSSAWSPVSQKLPSNEQPVCVLPLMQILGYSSSSCAQQSDRPQKLQHQPLFTDSLETRTYLLFFLLPKTLKF